MGLQVIVAPPADEIGSRCGVPSAWGGAQGFTGFTAGAPAAQNGRQQRVVAERLVQLLRDARLECNALEGGVVAGGDEDDRQLHAIGEQARLHLQPARTLHLHVEQRARGRATHHRGEERLAGLEGHHLAVGQPQQAT